MKPRIAGFLWVLGALALTSAAHGLTLSQNFNDTIVSGVSVSCNSGGITHENSYYRAYDLTSYGITTPFTIESVMFGVELAAGGTSGSQTVTVKLYDDFTTSATGMTIMGSLIGSTDITIDDGQLFYVNQNLTATTNTGKLVYEVFVPDGTAVGNQFFIGANQLGESAPGYVRAPDCGITSPTTYAGIGFDLNLVMSVTGSPVPEPGSFAALGPGALLVLRRRSRR